MTFWRVASSARSVRVALEGHLSGATAFLVGASPKLLDLDLRLLKLPGCWSLAINNAAVVFEPQAFIALDNVKCFNPTIFLNSRVQKFLPYSRNSELVAGKKVRSYPNTYFFDIDDKIDSLMSEFCRQEGPLPYWRATFFTSLAMLYQFGIRNVNLIGCTFDTIGYAHGALIDQDDRQYNKTVYDESVRYMKDLIPLLKDEGMTVNTCHDNTALDGICDYVPFNDAVSNCCTNSTSVEFEELPHKNKVD